MLGYPRERYLHLGVKSGEQFGKRKQAAQCCGRRWLNGDRPAAVRGNSTPRSASP
jgi:hypothetical protein